MAERILNARRAGELETTLDLARIVEEGASKNLKKRKIHPATLVFQAIRCAVKAEFEELEMLLEVTPELLTPGGRLAVISFHSLEDRRVKWKYRELSGRIPREGPALWFGEDDPAGYKEITRKPLVASDEEIRQNPRSRSAKLRVLERLKEERT